MTQEIHPLRLAEEPQLQSTEQAADRCLDLLFQDLEHTLEHESQLPAPGVCPAPLSLLPQDLQTSLSLVSRQPSSLAEQEVDLEDSLYRLYRPLEAQLDSVGSPQPRRRQLSSAVLPALNPPLIHERLLFGMASASWVITLLLWIGSQLQTPLGSQTNPGTQATRSVRLPQSAPVPVPRSVSPLPQQVPPPPRVTQPPAVAPPSQSPPPVVTERVYIPYYPPQPFQGSAPQSQGPRPEAVRPSTVPAPAVPTPVPTPAVTQVLQGVMALGDRSAALVAVDGVTQRVQVGDQLGARGWVLVKVAENSAVFEHQGAQRTVTVGQSF